MGLFLVKEVFFFGGGLIFGQRSFFLWWAYIRRAYFRAWMIIVGRSTVCMYMYMYMNMYMYMYIHIYTHIRYTCTIYNTSGRVVSDIQGREIQHGRECCKSKILKI